MFVALPEEGQAVEMRESDVLEGAWLSFGARCFDANPKIGFEWYSTALAASTRDEVAQVVEGLLQQTRIGEEHGDRA